MLQAVYEPVDCGKASARLFFADFTKGIWSYWPHYTDARAGQTRSSSCAFEMDRYFPDQQAASSKQLESEELCQIGGLWKEYPKGQN